ncbi:retrotransposon protein, putative, ty1-copia subclass [Tanacetum coccineum]
MFRGGGGFVCSYASVSGSGERGVVLVVYWGCARGWWVQGYGEVWLDSKEFLNEKLTGLNFNDWYRSLRIFLRVADTFDYLYKPCPGQPVDTATEAKKATFKAEYKKHSDVACIMLGKMSQALQRQFENYPPKTCWLNFEKCLSYLTPVVIIDLVDALHSCRQAPGKPISEHVLEMKGLIYQLHTLGKLYDNDMAVNLINRSLNKDFGDFVRNFQLHCMGFTEEKEKLSYGDQYLQVGNGTQAAVEAIGILAHIGKTRIEHASREGLLENIDEESFDKCESCISGKMTKKPFNKNIERATDLLGLIHTDVCGPLRHVSRKGASYFLTFTDDFSRYGYVYLLKHKHEVFETFKVFKAEVELQLGKKIKALRSDRGGEYLSQEFKDYLSENGIVQNLTSPYTPQQNGVSERRNRTLLDMVRSMFNLTTLPLSFWDYALESAVRILNMVPTKKVDKTPYEIWHGKAPNLSYLKVWGCEAYVKRDSADIILFC